jgi:hypothetical protein
MAQGMLERVVKEANTPAADPSEFNAKLRAIEKQLYGIETLSLSRLRQAREMQDRRIKLKHGQDYRPISLDALRTFRTIEGWPAIAIFSLSHPRFEVSLKAAYRPTWNTGRKHRDVDAAPPSSPSSVISRGITEWTATPTAKATPTTPSSPPPATTSAA